MSNKVLITNSQKAVKVPSGLRILIRRACNAVLEYEHFDEPAEISVTFVDNAAIAELNNQYLNKQMPTDVLSFPLGENGVYDVLTLTSALNEDRKLLITSEENMAMTVSFRSLRLVHWQREALSGMSDV